MINPKSTEDFYIKDAALNAAEFDYDALNTPSDELDGIDILVQMAKQGKINPWDINITEIADKYMLHLAEKKADNLRLSSRAWLFLAILLKLKSNVLAGIDVMQLNAPVQNDEELEDNYDYDEPAETIDYFGSKVIPIEDIIQRRTSVKLNRNRTVTLKDLIRHLEFYEQLDRKQAVKNTLERAKRKVTEYKNFSSNDIINLAHEDYIKPSVKILQDNLVRIFEKEEKVELNTLSSLGLDRTTAYMALLFLSIDSDYDLEQEEFYSDLYVTKSKQKLPEETEAIEG